MSIWIYPIIHFGCLYLLGMTSTTGRHLTRAFTFLYLTLKKASCVRYHLVTARQVHIISTKNVSERYIQNEFPNSERIL